MISSKYMKIIMGIFLSIAVVFTSIIMFLPKRAEETTTAPQEYETKVFNKEKITSINISMDNTNWNKMLENAIKEEYYKCDVTVNGTTFKNVGIRAKGNSSLTMVANSDSDRFSFKFKFDEYVDGQTCFGLNSFVVNNMQGDTTYMKEYLSYDMLDYIGVKTPLYAYSDISVNGKTWGLYLAVETLEESFATRQFGSDYGMLYKPESTNIGGGMGLGKAAPENKDGNNTKANEVPAVKEEAVAGEKAQGEINQASNNAPGGDMPQMPEGMQKGERPQMPEGGMPGQGGMVGKDSKGADLKYVDDNISSYSTIFDSAVFDATKSDYNRVIKALKKLSTGEELEKYVNVDETLRYFAANTVMVNLDSYVSNMKHNYYLYEKDGQISILPWDLNLSFAGFQSGSSTSAVNFPVDTPVTGVELSERPIIGKLLEVSEYKEKYHEYLEKIVSGYFTSGTFETTVNKLNTLIKEKVKNDPTAFYKYSEYEKSIPNLIEFGKLRAKSVEGQLNGTIPSTTDTQKTSANKLIDAKSVDLTSLGSQGGGDKGPGGNKNFSKGANTAKDTTLNAVAGKEANATESNITNKDKTSKKANMNNMPQGFKGESGGQNKESIIILSVSTVSLTIAIAFVIGFKRKKYKKCKKD